MRQLRQMLRLAADGTSAREIATMLVGHPEVPERRGGNGHDVQLLGTTAVTTRGGADRSP